LKNKSRKSCNTSSQISLSSQTVSKMANRQRRASTPCFVISLMKRICYGMRNPFWISNSRTCDGSNWLACKLNYCRGWQESQPLKGMMLETDRWRRARGESRGFKKQLQYMWPLTTIRTRNVQVSRKDHRKRQAQHKTGLCGAGPKNRQMKSAHLSSFSRTMMKRNRKKEKRTKRNGKLVDNFSPESDVTSLQDSFTSRPYKTPF